MCSIMEKFNFANDVPPWLAKNYQVFLVPSLIYPVFVHYGTGKVSMNGMHINVCMFAWNTMLAIYSAASTYYLAPPLLYKLWHYGYKETVCLTHPELSYLNQPWGIWVFYFLLSKVVELGDTVFLVLKGKKVSFLHWYHHLATLGVVYVQCILNMEPMEWAALMNVVVHTWMYSYYALSTIKPMHGNKVLTGLQIAQMVHGLYMSVYHSVHCNSSTNVAAMTLYGTYTVLFSSFFVHKYINKTKTATKMT